jgi:hypothetical protein
MSNQETLALRGRLSLLKRREADLNLQIAGLVNIIRQYIDPYESDRSVLKVEEAAEAMKSCEEKVIELRQVRKQAIEIENDLNG